MSILYLAEHKKRLHNYFISIIALSLAFTLIMVNAFSGNALAGSVGDVVTQVSNANLGSPNFHFGQEEATGYGFAIHAGEGEFGSGGCMLSVLGPVQPDEIQVMLDYVDGVAQLTNIQTTRMKGCEVREYSTDYGIGVGVILPDYFITVEMVQTGQSQAADFALAKGIAQQTLDGLEKAGLLSQAAPDIESGKPATEEAPAAETAPEASAGATAEPLAEPDRVADTTNIMAVYNGPTVPTTFSVNSPHLVTEIHDYHWNDAQGKTPGTIGLQDQNGKMYGPWQAVGTPGQGGVPNANWYVYPNIVIPAGTYTIIDSDPSTWSQNGDSGGKGMSYVMATPHFETTGAAPGNAETTSGSYPIGNSHSPAGVGSVGSIPGPSNTTEAVTGVVVPGLIATALGALGGLGGGGFIPPAGGTPMYPTGGGSMPGAGGVPGTSGGAPGMAQATNQFGRRRNEKTYIDTVDMYEGNAVQGAPADSGIYIETEREAGLFVQPEPFINDPGPKIFIDTIEMNEQAIDIRDQGADSGIIIDTAEMFESPVGKGSLDEQKIFIEMPEEAGLFVQPEPFINDPGPEIFVDTIDMHEQAIDIREPVGEAGIHIDTADMFEGTPVSGAEGDQEIFIETEDEAALFVKGNADREMGDGQMKPQAFSAREGDAGGDQFAMAENAEGAPAADQTEKLYTDSGGSEVLRDSSSLEDSAGEETAPEYEGAYDQNGFDDQGYDQEGFNQSGYDREGYNRDGFNEAGYNNDGFDKAGFDSEGFDKEGFDQAGFDAEGFNKEGYDKAGYDKEGFDSEGRNSSDYDRDGYNSQGYDQDGFDKNGFNKEGFNKDGFNAQGFDRDGFDANGFDAEGFDKTGFDAEGFDKAGFDKEGFDKAGFNAQGYNRDGYDQLGFDQEGYNRDGFDKSGYDREGFNQSGFDAEGYDRQGFNQAGFDKEGFNKQGFDNEGFNREGFDKEGFDKNGFNAEGYDKDGFNQAGFDKTGYNREGFDQEGFDKAGFNAEGYDKEGFNAGGYDQEGFNREGFDQAGWDQEGFNKEGFDKAGFDRKGFNKEGFDQEGYGRNGFDSEGFDREGYDINGYNAKGYNRMGYDAEGYNAAGFDKEGFNKDGWDKDGYGRDGLNNEGFDREGYDKNGYDAEGYDRDGYNREGQSKEGYDADGYDQKGFNENGYDRDGYDREGFDFEGYNRSGNDPWGFDKQGYGKDGYHWSGYNADGYDKSGLHWSENPYGDGSPFDVDTRNPFDGGIVDLGGQKEAWKPIKPPLGEPYHRTVEKYGAKSWTDEIPKPEPEKPTIPSTEDTGVIGPEDPMNTLKNHEVGEVRDVAPEDQPSSIPIPEEDIPQSDWPGTEPEERFPGDQIPETQPGNTFDYTDPETGDTSTYEYEPGYTGPRHGDQQTLVGSGDGQTYEIEFNAVTGKWVNKETGNDFDPSRFESWQQDVAEDKRRAAIDLEKMARREDATSKAIDKNLEDWRKLEQMQKAADKYNIGEPSGPGDVDKAIQGLKDDMLAGKELDQEKIDKIRRVIDHRIQGKTTADTGERWEEVPWYKDVGSALKANAAMAKEVVTGEKEDGSTSWLGMGARLMIMGATGGLAGGASLTYVTLDGAMNVAEAMYRIKDEIDKGGSDFRAVSKAVGLFVLGEQMGWLAGQAGGKFMGEMMERFPAFTNKAADLIESAMLKGASKNQMWSKALGMVSKESAEESLDQINKRLVDIGSDAAVDNIVKTARTDYGLNSAADSFDDVSQRAGKAAFGSTGDMAGGATKSVNEGWSDLGENGGRATTASDNIGAGAGRATSASDNMAGGAGKAASSTSDDMTGGAGKATSNTTDDVTKGAGKTAPGTSADTGKESGKAASTTSNDMAGGTGKSADDLSGAPSKTSAAGGDGPGEPDGRPAGDGPDGSPRGSDASSPDDIVIERNLNTNCRTPEEVIADPAAVARAEKTVQENMQGFDKLPPGKQQELVREQAIYDEYKMQAQERNYNLADKVQRGESVSIEDVMEMKADPASMRTLKNLDRAEGIGAELGEIRSRQVQSQFNEILETKIHQPSYRDVESSIADRLKIDSDHVRCRTVRTPGTAETPWGINTDNDVVAERLVNGPHGPEWVEIPKSEWQDDYYEAFAKHSGYSDSVAAQRFPDKNWAEMDEAAKYKEWAGLHEEAPMDVHDPMAAGDFSSQRSWKIADADYPGQIPGRNMVEATPEEIRRGADVVMIDGRPMRPASPYELMQRGEGNLVDSEQLGMMEKYKINDYWNKGDTPAELLKNQTEALEQLKKTAHAANTVEQSYRDMGFRVDQMPENMQEAIKVINNNDMSPVTRAARLQELGYETPGDFIEKVSSRIGAIKIANR